MWLTRVDFIGRAFKSNFFDNHPNFPPVIMGSSDNSLQVNNKRLIFFACDGTP
jgi:hypothetical protein